MNVSTFSGRIRAELARVNARTVEEMRAELTTFFLCAGRFADSSDEIPSFAVTASSVLAERLVGQFRAIGYDALAEKTIGKSNTRWQLYPLPSGDKDFSRDLRAAREEKTIDRMSSRPPERRAALRGAFLACGTMSDPKTSYRVEFLVKDRQTSDMIVLFLHAENIAVSVTPKDGRQMIYFKEGEAAANFLALIGAHNSLLQFENTRVDKELRNQVNRVVNCDTANARRQGDASARQIRLIEALLREEDSAKIPGELLEAARVRVDNPGLSVRDIGLLMNPPIGKSGMHHRLKKLEELCGDIGITINDEALSRISDTTYNVEQD